MGRIAREDEYRKIIEDALRYEGLDPNKHKRLVDSILLTVAHLASRVDVERIYDIARRRVEANQ